MELEIAHYQSQHQQRMRHQVQYSVPCRRLKPSATQPRLKVESRPGCEQRLSNQEQSETGKAEDADSEHPQQATAESVEEWSDKGSVKSLAKSDSIR